MLPGRTTIGCDKSRPRAAEGRAARRVYHALIDRLIEEGAAARPSRRRMTTVHGDLYDKQGNHKSATHRGPEGVHPWRARSTTRPRQPLHKGPREPETCNGKESEAEMRENHQERGRERRARKRMRWAGGRLLIERVRSAATPRAESHAAP